MGCHLTEIETHLFGGVIGCKCADTTVIVSVDKYIYY
jgi:hypothetical protein